MIKLFLNCSLDQPVNFVSYEVLEMNVISNPFRYDGLMTEDGVVVLRHVECYDNWEVEVGIDSTPADTVEEAVKVFIEEIQNA